MEASADPDRPRPAVPAAGSFIHRHALATRLWHWLTAVTMFVMIGSGVGILKAHPHLYWGDYGANFDTPWLSLARLPSWVGTGLNYLTIPTGYNLAMSRRWHLFFALVLAFALLAFMVTSLANRHFQRQLRIRAAELAPRHVLHDFREHLALRFHDPADPLAYNIFQKLSYVGIIFVLIPLVILTGMTMSPALNATFPWMLDLFGGRQSARSLHFIAAFGITLFTVVHLALVILAGAWNEVRSMVTGRWRVPGERS